MNDTTTKISRIQNFLAVTLLGALAFTTTPRSQAEDINITPAEIKAIAEEGFIYGLPIVTN